jgi:hypothetical protein
MAQEALAQEVEAAYSALVALGLPLESRYVAYFSGANESFTDQTGIATGRLQGVTLSRFETRDDEIVVVNKVFFINGQTLDEAARNLWPGARQSTIMHELVHLALAEDSRPYMPPWLTEGLAVHYAGQGGAERRTRLLEDGRLAQLSLRGLTDVVSLGEHDLSGERASYEYTYSGAVIAYLIERYGEERVLDFYRSYSRLTAEELRGRIADSVVSGVRPGVTSPNQQQMDAVFRELSQELTNTAVKTYFGRTLEELDEEVKAWLSS